MYTKLAVITPSSSDLSALFERIAEVTCFTPEAARSADFSAFDALAILGGTEPDALTLPIDARLRFEMFLESGKPVFLEWCASYGLCYGAGARNTEADRMVWVGEAACDLVPGDLLDDHCGSLNPPRNVPAGAWPLLYDGGHVMKHDHLPEYHKTPGHETWALWHYSENLLVCSLRLCNFNKARFVPAARWRAVLGYIAKHLTGCEKLPEIRPVCRFRGADDTPDALRHAFELGMGWFENAGIYFENGVNGVTEGLSHTILPDGTQKYAAAVRADCAGEVAGACFFDRLLTGSETAKTRMENLFAFCFEKMQVKSGPCAGMLRWTTTAWSQCYQDDVARAMLGTLLYMRVTGDKTRLPDVEAALDFLVATTGTDGLRVPLTDIITLDEAAMRTLREMPGNFPCAHFNAYYHAVLLLTYQLDGREYYRETAVKGLTALMAAWPETIREHSETQELCRLIFPLACLYDVAREARHLSWLTAVAEKLETFRHASGGYVEYDTGYKANRSRTADTESSLLADNGDEVADLLYSLNWLPLAFAHAWRVTGEEVWHARWRRIADFMVSVQTLSENPSLNGSWNRGIDLARMEAYGVPHDVGWGPCCAESGWTVAEILMGLGYGMAMEEGKIEELF